MPHSQRWVLERNARWFADDTAVRSLETGETLTYSALDRRVNRVANGLRDRGFAPGDRIALVLDNVVTFPVALYACHKIGAVAVPLNYRLSPGEFAAIFDDTNAGAVLYGDRFSDDVEAGVERSRRPPERIPVGGTDGGYGELLEAGDAETPPPIQRQAADASYIIYTSGTTGKPKGAVHTVRSARERVTAALTAYEFHADATCFSQLPYFHGGGLDCGIRTTVAIGGELVITPEYTDIGTSLDAIEQHEISHMVGSPTVTNRFLDRDDLDERDLSSIEMWYHTGEVLTENQARAFVDSLTPNIYNSYGSSEAGFVTVLRPDDIVEQPGAAGAPTINTAIRVIELDSTTTVPPEETVPDGEEGEVIVAGDQIFPGYFAALDTTNEVMNDGWYYTGDIGVIEDGILTISGRVDDVIVSGGELISPAAVEDTLEEHEAVEDAVAVGVDDDEWGQHVKAAVVAAGVSGDDLDEHCLGAGSLADFKRPREYVFVDAIEYTETGKKRRAKYR